MSEARASEDGFTIVEVLVSAIVVVMIALATFGAIQSAGRAAGETRARTQAYAIAQQDQAALRALKISTLSNYSATRTLRADNRTFTIASTGEFITDTTGTQSCSGNATADYISISSTVTWVGMGGRPPVVIKSIVAPPNGTIGDDRGALAVNATNSRGTALSGLRVAGTGPATFSDTTDSNGCVLFGNLPAGNYTLTPSSTTTLVDKDGVAPRSQTTSVVAQSTNTVTVQYDRPGTVNMSFQTRVNGGSLVASTADTVMAFNSGMTVPKRFGTLGTRVSTLAVGPLFPFTSPDSFYAGACAANNPVVSAPTAPAATVSLLVPVAGTASATIVLPALNLTVRTGTSSSSPGTAVANARVTVTDRNCSNTRRVLSTNATGNLPDPGLPYSNYDVCADNGVRRLIATNVAVKDTTAGTNLTMYLGGTGSVAGTCP